MYQSLYRTWRPMTFSDMVGQQAVVRTLRNQNLSGHIGHAYLFCGSRGTGKTSSARIMSMAINCQSPVNGDPCLKCEACKTLMSDAALDVFEMDAASNSRVEEIRDMLEKVSYPPQHVRYKVYIIDEVHMLSNAAFNALLKTLEEPPEYMVFILATTEPQKLPATILSRCQRFDFGRIAQEEIENRLRLALKDGQTAEDAALHLISAAAEGSMRDAWSLMDMCLEDGKDLTEARVREALGAVSRGFLFEFTDALHASDAARAMRLCDTLMQSGRDVQVFLRDLGRHLRTLIACGLGVLPQSAAPESRDPLLAQARSLSLARTTYLMDLCMRTEADAKWASSQRTVLEVFALRACMNEAEEGSLKLQARMEKLEREVDALRRRAPSAILPESPAMDVPNPDAPAPDADKQPDDKKAEEAAPTQNSPEKKEAAKPALGSTDDVWNRCLQRIKREIPSIFGMVNSGRYFGFQSGTHRLAFSKGNEFYISFLNDPARRDGIDKILTEEAGADTRFEAVREDDSASILSREETARKDLDLLSSLVGRENIIVRND